MTGPVLQWRRADGGSLDGATVRTGKPVWMHESWLIYQGPPDEFRVFRRLGVIDALLRSRTPIMRRPVATFHAKQSGMAESISENPWVAGVRSRTGQASYFFADDRKRGPNLTVTSAGFSVEISAQSANAGASAGFRDTASIVRLGAGLGGSVGHERLTFEAHGITDPQLRLALVLPWNTERSLNAGQVLDDLVEDIEYPSASGLPRQPSRLLDDWLPQESPPEWEFILDSPTIFVPEDGRTDVSVFIHAASPGACLMALRAFDASDPTNYVVTDFVALVRTAGGI